MNSVFMKYIACALILITIQGYVSAGSIEGPIPQNLPGAMYLFIVLMVLGIGILAYYWYRGTHGHKPARERESEVITLDEDFDKLNAGEREVMLLKFLDDKNKSLKSYAAITLVEKFEKLSKNFREEQILILSKDESRVVRFKVAGRLNEIFDLISEGTRNKLIENLAADDSDPVRECTSDAIRWNVDKLPENLRNLLLKFAEDRSLNVRMSAANAVHANFNSLPENLREKIIRKMADDENAKVREMIRDTVKKYHKKLPGKLADEVLSDIEIL